MNRTKEEIGKKKKKKWTLLFSFPRSRFQSKKRWHSDDTANDTVDYFYLSLCSRASINEHGATRIPPHIYRAECGLNGNGSRKKIVVQRDIRSSLERRIHKKEISCPLMPPSWEYNALNAIPDSSGKREFHLLLLLLLFQLVGHKGWTRAPTRTVFNVRPSPRKTGSSRL